MGSGGGEGVPTTEGTWEGLLSSLLHGAIQAADDFSRINEVLFSSLTHMCECPRECLYGVVV